MAELTVDLILEDDKFKKALNDAVSDSKNAGERSGRGFSIGFGSALKIGAGIAAIRAVSSGIRLITDNIRESVSAAQRLEVYETQFTTILGSTKAAQKQLSDLQKFAATTPFQLNGLAVATRQLLSFGVEQENVISTLRQVGELAAGTGTAIEDLTIPYGRLISTQKLTLVELDKFADRGVNLYGKLSKQTGISLKNIRDEISKGRVDFEEFTKALNDLTSEGGTFFGATQAQSKTLAGLFSTLNDNVERLRGSVGQAITPILKGLTSDLIDGIGRLTEFFIANSDIIVNKIFSIARAATFLIKPFQLAFNFISAGFSALKTGIAVVLVGIAQNLDFFAGNALRVLSLIPGSVGKKAQEGLASIKAFGDAANATLKEQAAETKDEILNIFETGNFDAQIRSALLRYQELGLEGAEAFKTLLKNVKESSKEVAKEGANLGKSLNNSLGNAVANGIEKVSQALVQGEDIFKAFGQAALGLVADFAIQAGKLFVATGIAQLALFSSPAASIAAGAALIAAGTLAKSFFGGDKGGNANAPAGVGGGPLPTQPEFVSPDPEERLEPETRVSITVQGDIFDSEETGLRISRILEDASLNENVKVIGGIA